MGLGCTSGQCHSASMDPAPNLVFMLEWVPVTQGAICLGSLGACPHPTRYAGLSNAGRLASV